MKKLLFFRLISILVILLSSLTFSSDIIEQNSSFYVLEDTVFVDNKIAVNNSFIGVLEFYLPKSHNNILVYADGDRANPVVSDGLLKVYVRNATLVSYEYTTKDLIDKDDFIVNFKTLQDINTLNLELHLSYGDRLKTPVKDNALNIGSIFPRPTSINSDGIDVSFKWTKNNFKETDELSIYARLKRNGLNISTIIVSVLFTVFVMSLIYILTFRKNKNSNKKQEIKEEKITNSNEDLSQEKEEENTAQKENIEINTDKIANSARDHLIAEEKEIYDVLERKEGSCEQSTLVIATGIPKSTLSRVLFNLEERNFIYREKLGKKNIVHLKKENWNNKTLK